MSDSDNKFILSGPEVVTLAGQTVDKLIRAGDGDAVLLYLYVLKTHGQSTPDEAAAALGKSAGWVASAMAVLSRIGLIKSGNNTASPPAAAATAAPEEEPRRYTAEEIKQEAESGSDFKALIDEAQRCLGTLSPDALERLLGMYDGLRLPAGVIMLLITHCISESRARGGGRLPSMRYIEKAAYTWEREGIFTLDKAEEYLKTLEKRKSARGEIKAALQITGRELSASEKRYADGWIAMGFGADAVELAYDKTVLKTGKAAWGYMDAIMNSWHSKGIHTVKEISEKDGKPGGSSSQNNKKDNNQKFGAPNSEEFERMQRILQKIKDN